MSGISNPLWVFVPAIAVVCLNFITFVRMEVVTGRAMEIVRQGQPEPISAVAARKHYDNYFELPSLLYAACIISFITQSVSGWAMGFAWVFVAGRIVQSLIHFTYDHPIH